MHTSIKIAHISDLHLTQSVTFGATKLNIKRILGFMNWWRKRRFVHSKTLADKIFDDIVNIGAGHVALTGDITHLGLPIEHQEAKQWLEERSALVPITFIPGNHDIYSSQEDIFSCLQNLNDFIQSDKWGATFYSNTEYSFPVLRKIGPVVLIGLNTAHPTLPFKADGFLGDFQLSMLDSLLHRLKEQGLIRVVLLHHPPLQGQTSTRRALKDANNLEGILYKHGAELILHGHNHYASLCWLKQYSGNPIPIVGVGSGSLTSTQGKEKLASYHLFNFEIDDQGYELIMSARGLKNKKGGVVELSHQKIWPTSSLHTF